LKEPVQFAGQAMGETLWKSTSGDGFGIWVVKRIDIDVYQDQVGDKPEMVGYQLPIVAEGDIFRALPTRAFRRATMAMRR